MKKILVCEDEAAIRDFVVINLTRAGYDVVEADCGEAALKKYEENDGDFDIAILDVMMPGINGFEVCKELRNRNGGIGIIMLSAKTQEMDKVTGLMLGADDYVAKPFSPSELLARVDSLYRRVALAQSRSENNFKEELKSGEFILNLRNRALLKNGKMIERRLSSRSWNTFSPTPTPRLTESTFSTTSGATPMWARIRSSTSISAV